MYSAKNDNCFICSCSQGTFCGVAGCIILFTGLIGWLIAIHQHNIYDLTTCEIIFYDEITNEPYPPLATKSCSWCDEHCVYCCKEQDDEHNCIRHGQCCHCDYVSYTCSGAQWEVEYNTLNNTCPDIMTTIAPTRSSINWKHTSGNSATQNSRNRALSDQNSRKIGSTYNCYYNHNNCSQVVWHIESISAWFAAFMSGTAIMGYGIIFALLACCIWTRCLSDCRRSMRRNSAAYRAHIKFPLLNRIQNIKTRDPYVYNTKNNTKNTTVSSATPNYTSSSTFIPSKYAPSAPSVPSVP